MKKIITLPIVFIFIFSNSFCQDWNWAKNAGGDFNDEGECITSDNEGNIIVGGHFESLSIGFGNDTFTNNGLSDFYMIKYNNDGDINWAYAGGGNNVDLIESITTDSESNIYITGSFSSSNLILGNDTLINSGDHDIFLAKFNKKGIPIWAFKTGGVYWDVGRDMALDDSGNIYMAGHFRSSNISFGSLNLTNSNPGVCEVFIAKIDSAGIPLWAKKAGGLSSDRAYSISTDSDNNIFVGGYFASPNISFGTLTLTNQGSNDIFLVKANSQGNYLWAKSAGGTGNDEVSDLATDIIGNVFVSGNFTSSSLSFGTTVLTSVNQDNIYIAGYDKNGNPTWAESAGGDFWEVGRNVCVDAGGNAYLVGHFRSQNINFGTLTLTNINPGVCDIFIVKFNSSGQAEYASRHGGLSSDRAYGATIGANGNVFITGYFGSDTVFFDTLSVATNGSKDMFIARLNTNNSITITNHPANATVCTGDSTTFQVSASGLPPFAYQWQHDGINITVNGNASTYIIFSALQIDTGEYHCVVTNYYGSNTSNNANLSVAALIEMPTINQLGLDSLECSVSGTEYHWFFNDNLVGQNSKIIKATQSGKYKVFVYQNNCISDTSADYDFLITNMHDRDELSSGHIEIYPNPVKDKLMINISGYENGVWSVRILHLDGKLLYTGSLKHTNVIDLNGYGKGIYILKILSTKNLIVKKIVIE